MKKNLFGRYKKYILLTFLFVCFLGFILLSWDKFFPPKKGYRVCFQYRCFDVEIADTDQSRQKGLMFRESLKEKMGMLFVFPDADIYSFWMKNTLIPLDMIWIKHSNGSGFVVDVQSATPCQTTSCPSYIPSDRANYVLEINYGLAKKYNISIGDSVFIDMN